MSPDDYQQVKGIFQSVLELPADRRAEELDARCPDAGVRREVERLLGSYESGYLEQPPAGNLTSDVLDNGHQLGHYKIVSKIGSGGMGEVYLAEDGKLGRQVAIKLLPETFIEDAERLRRFEQEARTASALNHPNILTIFEIGKTDNTHYIATEYIEGETLRSKLNRGRLNLVEALDIAVQCASALAAAHDSGIIHRDIKPENIMLRRDNLVKLLDFGLAKPVEKRATEPIPDAPTEKHVNTAPGVIMGTVQYMSPEQTRGQATDTRTDIWSLGCVIYEMLAGRPPFRGDTTADLIAEIVKSYPAPLSGVVDDIPDRLEEIVAKTLEKDPDERYQTAKDLVIDLKRLRRKFEIESELERSNPRLVHSGEHESNVTTSAIAPLPTKASSVEYLVVGMKLHKRTAVGIVAGLVALVGGTAYLARTYWRNSNDARFAYAGKIQRAVQALETSNFSSARQLLDETMPKNGEEDLRGFEWGYLSQLHAERSASQPMKLQHQGMVDALAFAADGNSLATAGGDKIVRIWDVATGNEVTKIVGHTDLIVSVAFSPDKTKLLTGSVDKTARLWDIASGQELLRIPGMNTIESLVFLRDGKSLAGVEDSIKVWDVATGADITETMKLPDGVGHVLATSTDGKLFAAQDAEKAAIVWDAKTGRVIHKLDGKTGFITDLKFSPDSKSLLVGTVDGLAKLWDLRTGKQLKTFKGHAAAIRDVAFSPDEKTIATGSEDDTIKVWDVEKGFEIDTLQGHSNDVIALAFSPDGRKLASGGSDDFACIWNVPKNAVRGVLHAHTESVEGIAFSFDNKLLASASKDKTAKVWEVATERERLPLAGHKSGVNSVAFSPDAKSVATGSEDGKIILWDTVTGRKNSSIDSGTGIAKLLFSPEGGRIATGHFWYGPGVSLWEVATGKRLCGFEVGSHEAWDVQFSKNGKSITASFGDDAVRVWDSASCAELRTFPFDPDYTYGAVFRNDEKLIGLRIMNNRRALALIDAETGKEIASILGHSAELTSAVLSPNGKRLVTSGQDSAVKIWDTATGQELLSLKMGAIVNIAAFSPNGRILAAADKDGTVKLWRSDGN